MLAYLPMNFCRNRGYLSPSQNACLAILLTMLVLVGCGPEPAAEGPPLVTINDLQISKVEFTAAFNKSLKQGQSLTHAERKELEQAFLTQMIDRELTLLEARRRGISIPPAELKATVEEHRLDYPPGRFEAMLQERGLTMAEWQRELTQSLILDKLVAQVVGERSRVSDQEIDSYYLEHRGEFERPFEVRVRQILVADRAEGETLRHRLQKGDTFAEVARVHSLSPEADQGGDLGYFGRDDMPPEFEVVFSLPVGKTSPLIKSDYGYHLFLVEERREARRLSRQEAADEIRGRLQMERRETLYQEWLQELRGKSVIEVDWRQLEELP